jgi:hypothetical protein
MVMETRKKRVQVPAVVLGGGLKPKPDLIPDSPVRTEIVLRLYWEEGFREDYDKAKKELEGTGWTLRGLIKDGGYLVQRKFRLIDEWYGEAAEWVDKRLIKVDRAALRLAQDVKLQEQDEEDAAFHETGDEDWASYLKRKGRTWPAPSPLMGEQEKKFQAKMEKAAREWERRGTKPTPDPELMSWQETLKKPSSSKPE